jgi:outer membrane protein OmpA-like peptidoglycan-associated protein
MNPPTFDAAAVSLLFLSLSVGCASVLPRDGGRIDDHEIVKANCGVGNYLFRADVDCPTTRSTRVPRTDPHSAVKTSDSPVSGKAVQNGGKAPIAKLQDNKIEISNQVTFGTGNAVITPEGMRVLDSVAGVIVSHSAQILKVKIEGHTDQVGNPEKNMALSVARAESVKEYLAKKGIDSAKLEAVGHGMTRPKFDPATSTKAEVARNRRVEFSVETLSEVVQ